MEHYISDDRIKEFEFMLNSELKAARTSLLNNEKELVEIREERCIDMLDKASNSDTERKLESSTASLKIRTKKILKILKNMDDFGYCIKCGEEIGEQRLSIDVTFDCCVSCMTKLESSLK